MIKKISPLNPEYYKPYIPPMKRRKEKRRNEKRKIKERKINELLHLAIYNTYCNG